MYQFTCTAHIWIQVGRQSLVQVHVNNLIIKIGLSINGTQTINSLAQLYYILISNRRKHRGVLILFHNNNPYTTDIVWKRIKNSVYLWNVYKYLIEHRRTDFANACEILRTRETNIIYAMCAAKGRANDGRWRGDGVRASVRLHLHHQHITSVCRVCVFCLRAHDVLRGDACLYMLPRNETKRYRLRATFPQVVVYILWSRFRISQANIYVQTNVCLCVGSHV